MDNAAEVIREQMDQTRTDLQDKLETLEQQVANTVQGAAEAAAETVQTVKEAVQETVEKVQDTVESTVQSMKESLDVSKLVQAHPCAMVVGAAAVGFVAARWFYAPSAAPGFTAGAKASGELPATGSRIHSNGATANVEQGPKPGLWAHLAEMYADELTKCQGLVFGVAASIIREMLICSAPPALTEQITDIVDSVTAKMGGTPIRGSVFPDRPSPASLPAWNSRMDHSRNTQPKAP